MATPAQAAQKRDFLVGPVTLGPGDTLMVAVANANLGASCRATARVRFLGHDLGGSVGGARPDSGVVVDDIVKTDLGTAVLAPGQSAKIQVRGGDRAQSRTVQISIETDRLVQNTAPCINLGGTVVQGNGHRPVLSRHTVDRSAAWIRHRDVARRPAWRVPSRDRRVHARSQPGGGEEEVHVLPEWRVYLPRGVGPE
jgi:hypothetical protein